MDAPETLQPEGASSELLQIGDVDAVLISDDHVGDDALAVRQEPDLAVGLPALFRQGPCQFPGDYQIGPDPAAVEPLETLSLAR